MCMTENTVTESYHIFMSSSCFPQTPQYHICPVLHLYDLVSLIGHPMRQLLRWRLLVSFWNNEFPVLWFIQLLFSPVNDSQNVFIWIGFLSSYIPKECILKYANFIEEDVITGFSSIDQMRNDYFYTTYFHMFDSILSSIKLIMNCTVIMLLKNLIEFTWFEKLVRLIINSANMLWLAIQHVVIHTMCTPKAFQLRQLGLFVFHLQKL